MPRAPGRWVTNVVPKVITHSSIVCHYGYKEGRESLWTRYTSIRLNACIVSVSECEHFQGLIFFFWVFGAISNLQ